MTPKYTADEVLKLRLEMHSRYCFQDDARNTQQILFSSWRQECTAQILQQAPQRFCVLVDERAMSAV